MPNTKWASSKRGFHIACANIGNENLSLNFIAVVAFKARLVTAKPLFVYIPAALIRTLRRKYIQIDIFHTERIVQFYVGGIILLQCSAIIQLLVCSPANIVYHATDRGNFSTGNV